MSLLWSDLSQLKLLRISAPAVMSSSLTLILGGHYPAPGWTWGSSQKKRFALDAEGGDRGGEIEGMFERGGGMPFPPELPVPSQRLPQVASEGEGNDSHPGVLRELRAWRPPDSVCHAPRLPLSSAFTAGRDSKVMPASSSSSIGLPPCTCLDSCSWLRCALGTMDYCVPLISSLEGSS